MSAGVKHELPALPFSHADLAPVISAQTVELHHGKHHAAYFGKLNDLIPGTKYEDMGLEDIVKASRGVDQGIFNQAGQAWNHIQYWDALKPGGSKAPTGKLAEHMESDFGGFQSFKDKFVAGGVGVFGSGWIWLTVKGGKLAIEGTSNGDSPFAAGTQTLFGLDVWEHAYYLDYQNRRPDHLKAVLEIINWSHVGDQL